MASINVTTPKLAWMGTMVERNLYVAFSQHSRMRKLQAKREGANEERFEFITIIGSTPGALKPYLKNPRMNWSANRPIVIMPSQECSE